MLQAGSLGACELRGVVGSSLEGAGSQPGAVQQDASEPSGNWSCVSLKTREGFPPPRIPVAPSDPRQRGSVPLTAEGLGGRQALLFPNPP